MTAGGFSFCTHHYFSTYCPCDHSCRKEKDEEETGKGKGQIKFSKCSAKLLLLLSGKENDKKKRLLD